MATIIGLTGSIGTGKSTVSNMFLQLYFPVVDADKIAREVVEPGQDAYRKIVDTFGESILKQDKQIDRKILGKIVFSDTKKRKQLNDIVHPAIREEMLAQQEHYIKNGARCVVLDIPLLFESKLTHLVDKIIVVFVDSDVQLQRIMERDQSTKEIAMQRIKAQIPVSEKVKLADAVINNNGSKEETFQQLKKILWEWNLIKEQ